MWVYIIHWHGVDGGHGLHIYLNSASVCVAIKSKLSLFLILLFRCCCYCSCCRCRLYCQCCRCFLFSSHLISLWIETLLPYALLLATSFETRVEFSNWNFHFFHFFWWFILFCIPLQIVFLCLFVLFSNFFSIEIRKVL